MSFCKLNSGEIKFIWADDVEEKKMHVFSMDLGYGYDIDCDIPDIYEYSDIEFLRCDGLGNPIT